ncbi:MAG: GAP family protein [Aurantimicrobium sp.]|nr:GAP family protein [Aurantimicrobium sp.]
MLETFLRIIPLGIGAAMTPSLLGLQVLATVGPSWGRRSLMVIAGSALAFGIACAALFLGFAQLPHRDDTGPNLVQGILYLLASAVLVCVVVWLFRPHAALAERSEIGFRRRLSNAHAVTFFSIAFVLSIKDLSSFALLVPGLHDIATSNISIFAQILCVVLMFALALSPTLVPALWRLLRGPRAEASLTRLYSWTMRRQFQIIGFMAGVFAVYCLVMGLGNEGIGAAPW